jgi:hypothetical protein
MYSWSRKMNMVCPYNHKNSKRLRERPRRTAENWRTQEETWAQSKNGTFLRQAAWPLTALFLLGWLLSTLLLLRRLLGLLSGRPSNRGRALRLRLGTIMQSLDLGNSLVEGLALSGGNLELKGGGLTGTIGTL